jgi:hypothetical protein
MGTSLRRHSDSLHNSRIRPAAADIALHGPLDFGFAGMRILLEQSHTGHDHSRRAVAALHGIEFDEGFLKRMQLAIVLQSFDRGDLLALRQFGRDAAGSDGFAVKENRASAALSFAAAIFSAGEVEFFAEYIKEGPLWIAGRSPAAAVDNQFHDYDSTPFDESS